MSEIHTVKVSEDLSFVRIDRVLADALPELSRTRIRDLIESGQVFCEGKSVKPSTKLPAGSEISVRIPEAVPADIVPEPMNLDILYEDQDLLVINKPKGLPVHPAPGHDSGTLVNGLMYYLGDSLSGIGGEMRPGIVHRIDKDTTGSLIICKNDRAHRLIAEQLKVHSVRRVYMGICRGNFSKTEGTVEGSIGRDPYDRKRMAVVKNGGKEAVTHYRIMEQFRGYALAEFTLETGRTHQIRVHMSHIGHPLLGDEVYGHPDRVFGTCGQTLHAMIIGFIHPSTSEYMEFSAPLPDYFTNILSVLRTHYLL